MEKKEKQFYESPTATVLEQATIKVMVGSPLMEDYEYVNLDEDEI